MSCWFAIWSSNSLKYWDWISEPNERYHWSSNPPKYWDWIKHKNNHWALRQIPDPLEYLWIFTKAVHIGRRDRLDQAVCFYCENSLISLNVSIVKEKQGLLVSSSKRKITKLNILAPLHVFIVNLAHFDPFWLLCRVFKHFLVSTGLDNVAMYQNWQIWGMLMSSKRKK